MFSSLLGTRFEGIRTGSASQLELAVPADAGAGSDAVLALAWSDLLDFLAAGASAVLATVRLRAGCGVECAVRI